jgi:predicted site-specific integrase-resolvase
MALLLEQEVAQQIGIAIQTMRKWRHEGIGPAHIKIGRTIRYRQEDVDAFFAKAVEDSSEGKHSAKAG